MNLDVYIDGASRGNPGPSSAALCVLKDGKPISRKGFYLGVGTNNRAEYTALKEAVTEVRKILGRKKGGVVSFYSDSELLVRQINGIYRVRNEDLKNLHAEIRLGLHTIPQWRVEHIPRERNREADRLANRVLNVAADIVENDL